MSLTSVPLNHEVGTELLSVMKYSSAVGWTLDKQKLR